MSRTRWSVLAALALVAQVSGCRFACDGPLGHYGWSLGHRGQNPSDEASVCSATRGGQSCPPPAPPTPPPDPSAMAPPASIDCAASSELMPLPTRPVFGARLDGRQAGQTSQPLEDEPSAEEVPVPPPSAANSGTSLKSRAVQQPATVF